MEDLRILVVDDDPDMARAIADALTNERCRCEVATTGLAALAACRQTEFEVVVTDMRMEGMDGRELLARLRRLQPDLPVILVTAEGTIGAAVEAVKNGAYEYLTKPFEPDALRGVVNEAIASRPRARRRRLRSGVPTATEELIGTSAAMVDLRRRVELIARAQSAALIQGETGTGKELVARAIHACSPRRNAPFVTVNASAIPETLLESEMFGHTRGAFTGASQAHRGHFTEADGGSLVLDEIGDMPLGLQTKLLRVLQSGEIRPVGAERTHHVDVRVIAATHRRLADLVREGKFREDLYYRLNVVNISVPPLRARQEDIPELASFFLERARERAPESPARTITPELIELFVNAAWPGNVRELESAVERLVVLAVHADLTPADLAEQLEEDASGAPSEGSDPSLERLIQRHVNKVLVGTNGNKALAAKLLGVDLSTLYRWQRKWSE